MREKRAVVPAVEGSCCSIAGWYAPRRVRGWPLLWSILLACLLLLISFPSAQAACRVGLIDTDTVWSVADSLCIVDQSVWVVEGVTSTIEAGVEVKINTDLGIRIDGTLIARGTPTAPITFGALRVRL